MRQNDRRKFLTAPHISGSLSSSSGKQQNQGQSPSESISLNGRRENGFLRQPRPKLWESYINREEEKKATEPKGTEKLMGGLQITPSRPFIPGNTTHNWSGFRRKKGKPSILHHQLFIFAGSLSSRVTRQKLSREIATEMGERSLALGLTASNRTHVGVSP